MSRDQSGPSLRLRDEPAGHVQHGPVGLLCLSYDGYEASAETIRSRSLPPTVTGVVSGYFESPPFAAPSLGNPNDPGASLDPRVSGEGVESRHGCFWLFRPSPAAALDHLFMARWHGNSSPKVRRKFAENRLLWRKHSGRKQSAGSAISTGCLASHRGRLRRPP